jgi:membrane dipeptidase
VGLLSDFDPISTNCGEESMNRRQAMQRLGVLPLAVPWFLGQLSETASFFSKYPTFDLHCHPGADPEAGAISDQVFKKTTSEMRAGGLAAAFFSIVGDVKYGVPDGKLSEGEAWSSTEKQLNVLDKLAKRENISFATSVGHMQQLHKRGQIAAFLSCEGGHGLEGKLDHLDDYYARGVRSLQLVHYVQNTLGDMQTGPPVYNGLSAFGRDVVRRMNRLGMLVDVAHASFPTVTATVDSTSDPIMLSHTHLQSNTSPHPRLITVEHARLVSSTGGLIGAWPSGFANRTVADFVDQTMRLIDAVGVDHVGLGTDMDGNYEPVFSSYKQLPDWVTALRSKGLSEADVAKVVGGNAVRVLNKVLKT